MMTITLDLADLGVLTDEQFVALCGKHRDYHLERTAKGELQIMPPSGGDTGSRNSSLNYWLYTWVRQTGRGKLFDSSTGFLLPNLAIRAPDAAWVDSPRWEALSPDERRKFPPLCPDFVVELCSPSDSVPQLREKMSEYMENGARLGWLLLPEAKEVEIYRPGRPVETLHHPTSLGGEDVLPGLVVELDQIL